MEREDNKFVLQGLPYRDSLDEKWNSLRVREAEKAVIKKSSAHSTRLVFQRKFVPVSFEHIPTNGFIVNIANSLIRGNKPEDEINWGSSYN